MDYQKIKEILQKKPCPNCGMNISDIVYYGKFGCGNCYNYFIEYSKALLGKTNYTNKNYGKIPKNPKSIENVINNLKQKINQAIKIEDYESAAKYRDEIKELSLKLST